MITLALSAHEWWHPRHQQKGKGGVWYALTVDEALHPPCDAGLRRRVARRGDGPTMISGVRMRANLLDRGEVVEHFAVRHVRQRAV